MRLRSEGVTWQEIEGELVILDVVSSSYLTTNESGAFMTKLLTQERTVEDLVQALVEEYGISEDVARTDTEAFLAELRNNRLLA